MIQLATDPKAARSTWRPAASDAKDSTLSERRPRNAHAWPFIARFETTQAPQGAKPTPPTGSES
jgi:hypothetical protein